MKKLGFIIMPLMAIPFLANCNSSKDTYKVTWLDYDGTVLKTQNVKKGVKPSYQGTPTHPADAFHSYTFDKWLPEIQAVDGDQTYFASYQTHFEKDPAGYMKLMIPEDNKEFSFDCNVIDGGTVTIDWCDGTTPEEVIESSTKSHTYSTSGEHDIRMFGSLESFESKYHVGNGDAIVEMYFGKDIKKIISNSFYACAKIRMVTFSSVSSLTEIGSYAFHDCSNLTSINIPGSVTTIGEEAFFGTNLPSINISRNVTFVGEGAFSYCSNISSIVVDSQNPNYTSENNNAIITKKEVDSIPANTLIAGCKNTTIPNGVISIADDAFTGVQFDTIEIPSTVSSIGMMAFQDSAITSISIPASVSIINQWTFFGCSNLNSIYIHKGITYIGSLAFAHCTSLKYVTFEEGSTLNEIGGSAFKNCLSLTEISIPASVNNINGNIFPGCTSLKSITVSSENQTYVSPDSSNAIIHKHDKKLILGCNNTVIPDNTDICISLGNESFFGLTISSITIPNNITKIENSVFEGCKNLKIVDLTSFANTPNLQDRVFDGCDPNIKFYIQKGMKSQFENHQEWGKFKGHFFEEPAPIGVSE